MLLKSESKYEQRLNITNGDSKVEIMKQANIPGVFLPWHDILHKGPVPDNQYQTTILTTLYAERITSVVAIKTRTP